MKKILAWIVSRSPYLTKVIMFLITIAGILYMFPREISLVLEYQQGQSWLAEDLKAPFDFPLLKTEEELKAERERLKDAHIPIFSFQDTSRAQWQSCWDNILNQSLETLLQDPRAMALHPEWNVDSLEYHYRATADEILDDLSKLAIVAAHPSKEIGSTIRLERSRALNSVGPEDYVSLADVSDILSAKAKQDLVHEWIYESILPCIGYNYHYNDSLNVKLLAQSLAQLPIAYGQKLKGDLIISNTEVIHESEYKELASLESALKARTWRKSEKRMIMAGQMLLIALCLLMLALFLFIYRKEIFHNNASIAFLLLNVMLMVLMAILFTRQNPSYIYYAPFCILPLMIRAFFDTRLALYVHLVTMLLIGFLVPKGFEFIFLQLIAGCVATLTAVSLHKRSDLFMTVGKISLIYMLSYTGMMLIQKGSFDQDDWLTLGMFLGNGGLTLFAFPLVYLYEKVFGMVSDVSLLELSDTNSPLLRDLNQKAPGSFQHSLQVANLAEAVVQELGGNTLLMRAGALYHDIGKMDQPQYFIENQVSGMNPHDDLSFEESTKVIINHVIKGIEMAKQHKLPDRLIDFIRTHHGTTTVQYFYKQYIKTFPEELVDKERFAYPGPKPFSMETAVLMMTDAVEAASRSLQEKTEANISGLVDKIIDLQMDAGQFDNVDLTFKDIEKAKKIFKRKLISIYHVRIAYPD